MNNFALITWASSWIWFDFAEIFAKDNINLVLVARSFDKLKEIKQNLETKYKIQVFILEKDLSEQNAPKEVYEFTNSNNLRIDYLVNNAWFWDYWDFSESDVLRNTQMINLNILSLTNLTRYYVSDMKKNKFWKILNISSTASFQPWPYMAVYFATKAYVSSFSLALASELKNDNITITTLCPWPTKSNFEKVSNSSWIAIFSWKVASSYDVAMLWYKSMLSWKKIVVHWFNNWLKAYGVRFLPTELMLKMMSFIMKK